MGCVPPSLLTFIRSFVCRIFINLCFFTHLFMYACIRLLVLFQVFVRSLIHACLYRLVKGMGGVLLHSLMEWSLRDNSIPDDPCLVRLISWYADILIYCYTDILIYWYPHRGCVHVAWWHQCSAWGSWWAHEVSWTKEQPSGMGGATLPHLYCSISIGQSLACCVSRYARLSHLCVYVCTQA